MASNNTQEKRTMTQVFIGGLDKALVLQTLWNNSKAQGMSFLGLPSSNKVEIEECYEALATQGTYFDYWKGKVLKVDIGGDSFDPWGYDRDNGEGAAANAIASIA